MIEHVPMITEGLLDVLRDRLERYVPAHIDHLRPGLSSDEMESLASKAGIRLSTEARRWYGWHDGIARDSIEANSDRAIGPNEVLLPLSEALAEMAKERQHVRDLARTVEVDLESNWSSAWLPVGRFTGPLVCDCDVDDGAPSPILLIDPWLGDDARRPRAPSFGRWIEWWIEALDTEAWQYDAGARRWHRFAERLRPELERTFIV